MYKPKIVLVKEEARDKILEGANFLADAVKLTLGPAGLNAISGLQNAAHPHITNDGYTIAKDISLNDPLKDLGVKVIREATSKTNSIAGDGTTTSTLLAQVITQEAMKLLPGYRGAISGKKTISAVLKAIKTETEEVVEKLKKMATMVKSKTHLVEIARVAVEDESLAKLIGETQWDIGPDGVIVVEDTNEVFDSVERIDGIRIDNGYATSRVINNIPKQSLELKDVKVILSTKIFNTLAEVRAQLDMLLSHGVRDILLVGRAFSETAIKECAANEQNGVHIYPVNAPYENQKEIMRDLQAVLGATFFDREEKDIADLQLSDVGFAKRVVITRWNGTFAGSGDDLRKKAVKARLKELKQEYDGELSEFAKRNLRTRMSQLENGLALLKIGAFSETERAYKKDKADDAVNAVRAALQEGVVAGGGLALKTIGEEMPDSAIIKKALLAPHAQIMANAGEQFDIPEWVKDPVKVVRVGLEQAASAAKILATTAIAIDYDRERPMYVQEQRKPEGESKAPESYAGYN